MIKAILWDFDGVIADSVNVKTEGFYELYLPYGNHVAEKVKKYHLANGGMSRFKKFEYFQTVLLGQSSPVPGKIIESLANRFSQLVLKKVINAPYVKGVQNTLEKYSHIVDNYIVSGTPMEEMKIIIKERKLDGYFNDVYGSPKDKKQLTDEIITKYGYYPNEIVFIGDALSDFEAAKHGGTFFILRKHSDNIELFKNYQSYSINDFLTFDSIFNEINNL